MRPAAGFGGGDRALLLCTTQCDEIGDFSHDAQKFRETEFIPFQAVPPMDAVERKSFRLCPL
jgi:hypothetical protein